MKKGFTLIELLVVVLIVGILASIALPMYTKTVEKTRVSEAWINLKAVIDAQERMQLQDQSYAAGSSFLDIGIDGKLDLSKQWDDKDEPIVTKNFAYHFREGSVVADRLPGNKFYLEYFYAKADHEGKGPRGCFAYNDDTAQICEQMHGEMWGPEDDGFYYTLP